MNDREKDDQQTDRMLTRREVIGILGGVAGAGVFGSAAGVSGVPGCVGRPQQTEGPYFLETQLNRSDIRTDPSDDLTVEGVPLMVEFRVFRVSEQGCSPLEGAIVDVWHCDAAGIYSDVTDNAQGFNTVGQKFLRGQQTTDASGVARFTTIFPGWYSGRTTHIHVNVHVGGSVVHTGQLYFADTTSAAWWSGSLSGCTYRRVTLPLPCPSRPATMSSENPASAATLA